MPKPWSSDLDASFSALRGRFYRPMPNSHTSHMKNDNSHTFTCCSREMSQTALNRYLPSSREYPRHTRNANPDKPSDKDGNAKAEKKKTQEIAKKDQTSEKKRKRRSILVTDDWIVIGR